MKRLLLILLVIGTLFSCSKVNSDNDKLNIQIPLELSVPTDETITDDTGKEYCYIKTDDYDFEFNIISGNGDYEVVESKDCRVTIENEHVVVNMYRQHSNLVIKDGDGLQKMLWIQSSNDMFYSVCDGFALGLSLFDGNTSEHTFDFGIGDYTIECVKGNSAMAEFISHDRVLFTPVHRGTTHFQVKDGRGLSVPYEVVVSDIIDMRDYFTNVDVVAEDCLNILIDKSLNWEIQSVKTDTFFEILTIHRGDDSENYDFLQVNISESVEKDASGSVQLISERGSEVEINFNVN